MSISSISSTTTVLKYGDNIYISEAELFDAEGVSPEEAEPFEVQYPLPDIIFTCAHFAFVDAKLALLAIHTIESVAREVTAEMVKEGCHPDQLPRVTLVTLMLNEEGRYAHVGYPLQAA